jgi:hypothetical protein
LDLEDRIGAALVGYCEALDRFDGGSFGGFIALAKLWMRRELQRLAFIQQRGVPIEYPSEDYKRFGPPWLKRFESGFAWWDDRPFGPGPRDIPVTPELAAYYVDLWQRWKQKPQSTPNKEYTTLFDKTAAGGPFRFYKRVVLFPTSLEREDPGAVPRTSAPPPTIRWPMSFRAYYRSLAYNQALDEYQDVVLFDREGRCTKIASLDHDHPMFGMYDALRPKKPDELLLSKEAYMSYHDGRSSREIVVQLNPDAQEVERAKNATAENTPEKPDDECYAFEWFPSQPAAQAKITAGLYRAEGNIEAVDTGDVIWRRREWRAWKGSGDKPHLYRTQTPIHIRAGTASRLRPCSENLELNLTRKERIAALIDADFLYRRPRPATQPTARAEAAAIERAKKRVAPMEPPPPEASFWNNCGLGHGPQRLTRDLRSLNLKPQGIDIITDAPITSCLSEEKTYVAEGTTLTPVESSELTSTELAGASGDES